MIGRQTLPREYRVYDARRAIGGHDIDKWSFGICRYPLMQACKLISAVYTPRINLSYEARYKTEKKNLLKRA